MKKMLVVMVVALCIVFTANTIALESGIKAGLTLANIAWPDEPTNGDNTLKTGFTGGLMLAIPSGPIDVGLELLYTQKGEKYDISDSTDKFLKLDYIEVPVMAKIGMFPMIKVYGGVSMGFLVSAEMTFEYDGKELGRVKMKDHTNSKELSAIIGVQIKVSKLVLDARYNHGLTNTVKDNEGDVVLLRTFCATVGLNF